MKSKIKIMNPKPQVSDEEIRSFMDFDGLLKQRSAALHKRQLLFRSGMVVLGVVVITAVVFLLPQSQKSKTSSKPTSDSVVTSIQQQSGDLITNADTPALDNSVITEQAATTADSSSARKTAEQKAGTKHSSTKSDVRQKPDTGSENIYVQAEPVDGYENLFSYFRQNLEYPQSALQDSIRGVMKVSFVIGVDGKAQNIRVEETLGPLFDKEALKLISAMPAWRPALLNGKPVKSRISLPLTFDIRKVE